MCIRRRSFGFTLVEIVMALVIIGVAITGVLSVFVTTARHSGDPVATQQAVFIAEAYLEEILRQKFYDPDSDSVCPSPEASRASYDNVCDYNGITNQAPADAFGNALSGLSNYKVTVTVTRDNTVNLNGLNNNTGSGLYRVMRVDVTVTGPAGTSITLSGYRTNYNCNSTSDPGCKT